MEDEEEENIYHVRPRNKSKAQDSLQQTGIKIKRIIINLYLITCRHCNRKWKRNLKINIQCNDWNE